MQPASWSSDNLVHSESPDQGGISDGLPSLPPPATQPPSHCVGESHIHFAIQFGCRTSIQQVGLTFSLVDRRMSHSQGQTASHSDIHTINQSQVQQKANQPRRSVIEPASQLLSLKPASQPNSSTVARAIRETHYGRNVCISSERFVCCQNDVRKVQCTVRKVYCWQNLYYVIRLFSTLSERFLCCQNAQCVLRSQNVQCFIMFSMLTE